MFRSTRESFNREVRNSLKADEEIIRNTAAEGSFTVGREKGTFSVVERGGYFTIYVYFNFNGFPTSMWSQIKRNIISMVIESAGSKGFRVSESDVYFK